MFKTIKLLIILSVTAFPIILAGCGVIDANLAAVIVALLLGLVGLFQKWIRSLFFYPELEINFHTTPPDAHKTLYGYRDTKGRERQADCYYYRLNITNSGNKRAENVEVRVESKYKENEEGAFEKDENFMPLNLIWSHDRKMQRESIAPTLSRYCDFGFIIEPSCKKFVTSQTKVNPSSDIVLALDLVVKPSTGTFLVLPGKYRFKIIAVGDNSNTTEEIFEIELKDYWKVDEKEMLEEALKVRKVSGLQ